MKIDCNHTHRYGVTLAEIPQDDIAACPRMDGVSLRDLLSRDGVPYTVKNACRELEMIRTHSRQWHWLYVRPQWCELDAPDKRSGSFWHVDVDAVFRCVAPNWDDFRAMAVSFGDVAETLFIEDRFAIEVDGPPKSADYLTFSPLVNNGQKWATSAPAPNQVAHYTIRDFHRAGPIRRTGWRLIILAFETDASPQDKWP